MIYEYSTLKHGIAKVEWVRYLHTVLNGILHMWNKPNNTRNYGFNRHTSTIFELRKTIFSALPFFFMLLFLCLSFGVTNFFLLLRKNRIVMFRLRDLIRLYQNNSQIVCTIHSKQIKKQLSSFKSIKEIMRLVKKLIINAKQNRKKRYISSASYWKWCYAKGNTSLFRLIFVFF